jgi:mannose-6-phosphate isomerase-like protein (cupin superfamily)
LLAGEAQTNFDTETTRVRKQQMTQLVSQDLLPSRNDGEEWLRTRSGERCLIPLSAADTNGVYSLVEIVSSPGDGTPLHVHENEDEHIIVLEGTARIAYGDKIFDAEAGKVVTLLRKIPHAWGNRSNSQLRIAVVAFPGGVEEILGLIARSDEAGLPALAERFGVRRIGPAPF